MVRSKAKQTEGPELQTSRLGESGGWRECHRASLQRQEAWFGVGRHKDKDMQKGTSGGRHELGQCQRAGSERREG